MRLPVIIAVALLALPVPAFAKNPQLFGFGPCCMQSHHHYVVRHRSYRPARVDSTAPAQSPSVGR